MNDTIPHWLTKQASLSSESIAIETEKGQSITFHALEAESRIFAQQLSALGVKSGEHIGIVSNNHPDFVLAVHALSFLGAVAVLFNTKLSGSELAYQMNDAHVKIVLASGEMEEKTRSHEWRKQKRLFTFAEVKQAAPDVQAELRTELCLDDVFTIMYTSGTTGHPKGVVHTYGNHFWSAVSSALNLGLEKKDKWLAVLPMFHIGGLSIYLKSVIYGMPVYLMEKFETEAVHQAIINQGVTIASVVTIMLQRLLARLGEESYPDAFRCMLLGGGSVPLPVLEQAKAHHVPVFQSYGMTETCSQIATLSPSDALRKLGSAGKPLLPADLKIAEPDSEGIGEIIVKGPMVTPGYYQNEAANDASFKDGWLLTGDLGRVDSEGFLYVADRRKDLIISGGENVYPAEIESVLTKMDGVEEAGVCGVADEKWGQVPAAFIVASAQMEPAEVIHFAARHLAKFKLPKYVYFVDALPRNASNKLLRSELAKRAAQKLSEL